MALGEAVTVAIGIGCRRGCPASAIVALVEQALAGFERNGAGLFTIEAKRSESGLVEAAQALALPLMFLPATALAAVSDRTSRRSIHAEAALGVSSVAEAAALAGAGPGSWLAAPRIANGVATCAVAIGEAA